MSAAFVTTKLSNVARPEVETVDKTLSPVTVKIPLTPVLPVAESTVNIVVATAKSSDTSNVPFTDESPFEINDANVAAPDDNVPVIAVLPETVSFPAITVLPVNAATVKLPAPTSKSPTTSKVVPTDAAFVTDKLFKVEA